MEWGLQRRALLIGSGAASLETPVSSFAVPLNVAARRGILPAGAQTAFKRTQGKRARLKVHETDSPERSLKDGKVDAVSVPDWLVPGAIETGLARPMPWEYQEGAWQDLPEGWKGFVDDIGGGVVPHRWTILAMALGKRGRWVRDWEDLLRPELEGRIALPRSSREVLAIALRAIGKSGNSSPNTTGELEAASTAMATLLRNCKAMGESEGLRAVCSGDASVAVAPFEGVRAVSDRRPSIQCSVPASGTTLRSEFWAVPASRRSVSPLLGQWVAFTAQRSLRPGGRQLKEGGSPVVIAKEQGGKGTTWWDIGGGVHAEELRPLRGRAQESASLIAREAIGLSKERPSNRRSRRRRSLFPSLSK